MNNWLINECFEWHSNEFMFWKLEIKCIFESELMEKTVKESENNSQNNVLIITRVDCSFKFTNELFDF